jgi:hypothetical protein
MSEATTKMQLAGSKNGGWVYTHNTPESRVGIPA